MAKKKLKKWPIPGRESRGHKAVSEPVKYPEGKGVTLCNRSACLAPNPTYWNVGSLAMYCEECAWEINRANRRYDEPFLCYDVTNVPDGHTLDSFKNHLSQNFYKQMYQKQQLR